jgi:hypothetical protein
MIADLEVYQPLALENLNDDELQANIRLVLDGHLPGFVMAASMHDAFPASIACAKDLGLEGGVNSTTMAFKYNHSSGGLTSANNPQPEDWESLGITPLHADGEEGDRMLSINQALAGAYDITIFARGPGIADDMPIELWDKLHDENMGVLLHNKVNTDMLAARATQLAMSAGQTLVFNPSQPHMGVTRTAPRRSNATFFQTPSHGTSY